MTQAMISNRAAAYGVAWTNPKVGAGVMVTSSGRASCPPACPLKADGGCYAEYLHSARGWDRVDNGTISSARDYAGLLYTIKALAPGTLWRHNEKGDLVGADNKIEAAAAGQLSRANKGRRGFTYTHYPVTAGPGVSESIAASNCDVVAGMNKDGFTVNLSANTLAEADSYLALNIAPVVVLMPKGADKVTHTPGGAKVVLCPADTDKGITCARCRLCQDGARGYVIGFEAHGFRKNKVDLIAKG